MRRIEQDPEEIREIEEALSRHATPTHEQPPEEIDTESILMELGYTACGDNDTFPHGLVLRDPPEHGWTRDV